MAYRSDADALTAQCEALRRELQKAHVDAAEIDRLERELRDKTRELERLQAQVDPASDAARALRQRRILAAGLSIIAMGVLGYRRYGTSVGDQPGSAAWFEHNKSHCNSLEAAELLRRERPPTDPDGAGYLAACWALAGNLDEARRVITSAGSSRGRALGLVFDIAHPIADRGDDRSAGPIMNLVVELWPQNYQALYHAGMSDYAAGDRVRAEERLKRFLTMYQQPDRFTHNAQQALAGLAAGHDFATTFSKVGDPRIE